MYILALIVQKWIYEQRSLRYKRVKIFYIPLRSLQSPTFIAKSDDRRWVRCSSPHLSISDDCSHFPRSSSRLKIAAVFHVYRRSWWSLPHPTFIAMSRDVYPTSYSAIHGHSQQRKNTNNFASSSPIFMKQKLRDSLFHQLRFHNIGYNARWSWNPALAWSAQRITKHEWVCVQHCVILLLDKLSVPAVHTNYNTYHCASIPICCYNENPD